MYAYADSDGSVTVGNLYGPYPLLEDVLKRKLSKLLATRVSANLHEKVLAKQKRSGLAISEVLRRALRLWVRDELEDLLQQAGE